MSSLKTCTRCNVAKQLSEFNCARRATEARSQRGGFGVSAQCKLCISETRKPGLAVVRKEKADLLARKLKRCGACGDIKSYVHFHKRKASLDQLAYRCMECVNQHTAKWRQDNPGAHKYWYQANAVQRSAYNAKWRGENVEQRKIALAKWAKENPHKCNALISKRRAAKLRAIPVWADLGAIEAIYAKAVQLTRNTGIKHDVDHIVPLQAAIVSGLHWEANLQVIPKLENISKHNRRWPDMPC